MPNIAPDSKSVHAGDRIRVCVRYRLENDVLVKDSYPDGEVVTLGEGALFEKVEQALIGRSAGESISLELLPEEAYGEENKEHIQVMERAIFENMEPIKLGQIISFAMPSQDEVAGAIHAFNEDMVEVDFNHPCTGKNVIVIAEIKEILSNSQE